MGVRLEDVTAGALVGGIVGDGEVTVVGASSSDGLASTILRAADRNAWRSAATAGWLVCRERRTATRRAGQRCGHY